MERPRPRLRLRFPQLPRLLRLPHLPRLPHLLAAAVLVECCARLCPSLGSGTGSALGTAIPCAHLGTVTGERCQTDPERGAGTGWAPAPEATGQLQTEAELLPFPGNPTRTAEPPSPPGSTRVPQGGGEGTGPTVQDRTATEQPGVSVGTAELASAGSVWPSPAPAPLELDTAPTTRSAPGTEPGGNLMVEGAMTPRGTPSHSSASITVPSSEGQWGSPSTLPGWIPTVTGLAQKQGGSHSPSSPDPRGGKDLSATIPLGDSSPGTPPSTVLATHSPAPGTVGTSPFGRGLQSMLIPTGTRQGARQGLPRMAGGGGSDSRPWQGTGVAWHGPHSAPHPSLPSLGAGGHGDPVTSTAQTAVGTGPTSMPVAGKRLGLPVPTAIAGTPGVTSPGLGGALDLTRGLLGTLNTKGPTKHSPVPLDQTWHLPAVPGQPPTSVTLGSTTVAQSRVSYASPGSPHIPPSRQPAPISSSAAATSPAPQPFPGTSRGVPRLSPTMGTPPAGTSLGHQQPHSSSGADPAEKPQILGGIPTGVGDAGAWAETVPVRGQPGSLAPSPAPGAPQQPASSPPVSPLGPTTSNSVTATAVTGATTTSTITAATTTSTITAATASPAQLEDAGTIRPEATAVLLQGNTAELTWGSPSVVPGASQQLTKPPGTPGHGGDTGSPPAAGVTDTVPPSSSPGAWPDADTPRATPAPAAVGRAPRVFIVEDQPPLWRAPLLRIPCQLVLDMRFVPALQDPASPERRRLLRSFNRTVTALFMSVPGFLRLEVTGIREGSVVLEYDALFEAEQLRVPGLGTLLAAALGSGGTRPGLAVGTAPVLRNVALEWPLDPCAVLFACRAGFTCVAGADGNATCTSLCHRDYCKNHGICTHQPDRGPLCQCPVGSDFWFMGLRCDYRVTQQSLLGMAAGILLSIVLLGAAVTAIAIRRFKVLLLEARADQTRSSYRRFCRLDDVSAQYWSRSWLPSASSLDNPAFSNSEELLHLQMLDNGCCGCREDSGIADGAKQRPVLPARPPRRPSFPYDWDTSSSSMNDPMVDSGKASDISVSSWPMEPLPWTPFPLLHQLSRQRPHKARRPRSYCEGMELANLERSWTA